MKCTNYILFEITSENVTIMIRFNMAAHAECILSGLLLKMNLVFILCQRVLVTLGKSQSLLYYYISFRQTIDRKNIWWIISCWNGKKRNWKHYRDVEKEERSASTPQYKMYVRYLRWERSYEGTTAKRPQKMESGNGNLHDRNSRAVTGTKCSSAVTSGNWRK